MFFNFRVFMHSLIFFLILEVILDESVFESLSSVIATKPFWALLLFLLFLSFVFNGSLKFGKNWKMAAVPMLFASTAVGLIFFVDSYQQGQIFSILIASLYYLGQLGIYRLAGCATDQTARGILSAISVASIFLFYSLFYAIYLNFAVPLWFMMIIFFVVTSMVSLQYFQLFKKGNRETWKYSLIIGLVMLEISWVAHFWPFGYLTTAASMLIFYYVFWDLAQSHFMQNLKKRRVLTNIIFFGFLASIVMMSSRWLPVV